MNYLTLKTKDNNKKKVKLGFKNYDGPHWTREKCSTGQQEFFFVTGDTLKRDYPNFSE